MRLPVSNQKVTVPPQDSSPSRSRWIVYPYWIVLLCCLCICEILYILCSYPPPRCSPPPREKLEILSQLPLQQRHMYVSQVLPIPGYPYERLRFRRKERGRANTRVAISRQRRWWRFWPSISGGIMVSVPHVGGHEIVTGASFSAVGTLILSV